LQTNRSAMLVCDGIMLIRTSKVLLVADVASAVVSQHYSYSDSLGLTYL
jgi:hypothetical protein